MIMMLTMPRRAKGDPGFVYFNSGAALIAHMNRKPRALALSFDFAAACAIRVLAYGLFAYLALMIVLMVMDTAGLLY